MMQESKLESQIYDQQFYQTLLQWYKKFILLVYLFQGHHFIRIYSLQHLNLYQNRLQDHQDTRKKQLQYWSEIAHQYFKTNKINESSLSELDSESCKLFEDNGTGIKKRLAKTEVLSVLDQMINEGKISWKMQNMKENFIVFQHSIYELADSLYNWAKKWGKIGSIETVRWIINGEDTEKTEKFYGVPEEVVLRGLNVLQENGKAQIFELNPGKYSVKFV